MKEVADEESEYLKIQEKVTILKQLQDINLKKMLGGNRGMMIQQEINNN